MPDVGNTHKIISTAIASGQTDSDAIDLGGLKVFSIYLPAAFTGTTLGFKASDSIDGTFQTLYDDAGGAISITVAQGRTVGLTSQYASMAVASCRYIKLVSGSSEAGDRTIKVFGRA